MERAPITSPSSALRAAPDGATSSALPRCVGVRRHHTCVLDAAGAIVAEETIAHTREVPTALAKAQIEGLEIGL